MFKYKQLPDLDYLHTLFKVISISESEYGKSSGLLWKQAKGPAKEGSIAGTRQLSFDNRSDWRVRINRDKYLVSRIVYFMVYEIDPSDSQIDHIDLNSDNNNSWNLRLDLDGSIQQANRKIQSNNISGITGISWYKPAKKWRVLLQGKNYPGHLGYFTCKLEAAHVLCDAYIKYKIHEKGRELPDLNKIKCSCRACRNDLYPSLESTSDSI